MDRHGSESDTSGVAGHWRGVGNIDEHTNTSVGGIYHKGRGRDGVVYTDNPGPYPDRFAAFDQKRAANWSSILIWLYDRDKGSLPTYQVSPHPRFKP